MYQRRVLLLESPQQIENFLEQGILFSSIPIEFSIATTCLDGFKTVEQWPIDLIVAGLTLSDGEVHRFLQDVHDKARIIIPSIVVKTDNYDMAELQKVLEMGTFDIVQYPIPMKQLLKRVYEAVQMFKPRARVESFIEGEEEPDTYQKLLAESRLQQKPISAILKSRLYSMASFGTDST